MEFHLKPKGINGRNSQCKSCTAITRKRIRKSEKYKKKLLAQAQLETIVIGNLDEDTISDFGSLFAKGIVGLIEQGQI
jgi:hypothetical protein